MQLVNDLIANSHCLAWVVLVAAFAVLARCADLFVDSAVGLANRFKIPRLLVGIVLVSLATTAPELSVSLMSALQGRPEMAFGNAVGSVICDDGLALALCGMVSPSLIPIIPRVLRTSGLFLLLAMLMLFLFVVGDATLSRVEGAILVAGFAFYLFILVRQHRRDPQGSEVEKELTDSGLNVTPLRLGSVFLLGLAGILASSRFVILSAVSIAAHMHVPPGVIALTLVALGTSIPEVATCVAAARKNEGALAVGNILGADILNICWVAGASAMANSLQLSAREITFMFPWMFVIVGLMLVLLRVRYSFWRRKGAVLLVLYLAYLVSLFVHFRPGG